MQKINFGQQQKAVIFGGAGENAVDEEVSLTSRAKEGRGIKENKSLAQKKWRKIDKKNCKERP